jgi:hypothetical protein
MSKRNSRNPRPKLKLGTLKTRPGFQLIIQIGNFPRIKRYFVSPAHYLTKQGAIDAGKRWLVREGYEAHIKYIHTHRVYRGPAAEDKAPNPRQVHAAAKPVTRWIHEPRVRAELGIKDKF